MKMRQLVGMASRWMPGVLLVTSLLLPTTEARAECCGGWPDCVVGSDACNIFCCNCSGPCSNFGVSCSNGPVSVSGVQGYCPGYDNCGNSGFCGPGYQCCNNNQSCCGSSKAADEAEGAQGTPVHKAVEASFARTSTEANQSKASTNATQRCLERFKSLDTDKNGSVSQAEFLAWAKKNNLSHSRAELDKVFNELDKDNSKSIEIVEFDAQAAQDSNAGKK